MSQKKDLAYVKHILECITKIKEYTKNGKDEFDENEMVQLGEFFLCDISRIA